MRELTIVPIGLLVLVLLSFPGSQGDRVGPANLLDPEHLLDPEKERELITDLI